MSVRPSTEPFRGDAATQVFFLQHTPPSLRHADGDQDAWRTARAGGHALATRPAEPELQRPARPRQRPAAASEAEVI